jgi:hypothetical protein
MFGRVASLVPELRRSRTALALAGFVLVNVALVLANPLKDIDPEALPQAKTWAWWAVHNFKEVPQSPDVVLLGSSLLMNPVWQNEADFLNSDFDIVASRRTQYLENALQKRLGISTTCFNFALPGAFVSDDYMIVRTMLGGERKPKLAVFALSPRDFIENGLRSAAFSPHFRYLKHFTNIDDLLSVAMPHFWQRFGYYLDRGVFCWGKRLEIQAICAHGGTAWADKVFGIHASDADPKAAETAAAAPHGVLDAIYQDQIVKGFWIAKPNMRPPYNPGGVDEYKRRYKDSTKIDNQRNWLNMALDLCKQQGISVLVLNMPVTKTNLTVYPQGVYPSCVNSIAQVCAAHGARFVDLNAGDGFPLSDFTDMWHMNAVGGRRLLDAVVSEIDTDSALRATVTRSQSIAGASRKPL